jgi:hypothetical protein
MRVEPLSASRISCVLNHDSRYMTIESEHQCPDSHFSPFPQYRYSIWKRYMEHGSDGRTVRFSRARRLPDTTSTLTVHMDPLICIDESHRQGAIMYMYDTQKPHRETFGGICVMADLPRIGNRRGMMHAISDAGGWRISGVGLEEHGDECLRTTVVVDLRYQ